MNTTFMLILIIKFSIDSIHPDIAHLEMQFSFQIDNNCNTKQGVNE